VTDEHARESSQQPTRETATGGASRVVLEYGWASPHTVKIRVKCLRGLSPACRVPTLRLVAHGILALSLVFNLGISINLNVSHTKEGLHMVKTTNTTTAAVTESGKATGLGCVGNRVSESG